MSELNSALYTGWVRHRRFSPTAHSFRYKVFMVYLDLDELDEVLSLSPFWSRKRFAPAKFDRRDFHGDPQVPLKQALRQTIFAATGVHHQGPICLLANLRYFGYSMNPLCTYYCFEPDGRQLQFIVAEVTNTPWGERHAYVLRCNAGTNSQDVTFDKALHVSPFNPLAMTYRWLSNQPCNKLLIHLENQEEGEKISDATLQLQRQCITARSMNSALVRYPLMTVKVIACIYWQALRLWVKRIPLVPHPRNKVQHSNVARQAEGASDEVY